MHCCSVREVFPTLQDKLAKIMTTTSRNPGWQYRLHMNQCMPDPKTLLASTGASFRITGTKALSVYQPCRASHCSGVRYIDRIGWLLTPVESGLL